MKYIPFPKLLAQYVKDWAPVGSRETVNPPPQDTDQDYMVLCAGLQQLNQLKKAITSDGFTVDGKNYEGTTWTSYRKGDLNLIVTCDNRLYYRTVLAARICKALNLKDKEDRITVHGMLRQLYQGML